MPASGVESKTATITAATTSGSVPAGDRPLVAVIPTTWTSSDLTLTGSVDNVTFYPLYDSTGTQIKFTSAAQSNAYALNPASTAWARYLKVVTSVSQTGVVLLIFKDI